METLKATVVILIGAGEVYALGDDYELLYLEQANRHGLFWSVVVRDCLIGDPILTGWAGALITIGIQDIVRVSNSG